MWPHTLCLMSFVAANREYFEIFDIAVPQPE